MPELVEVVKEIQEQGKKVEETIRKAMTEVDNVKKLGGDFDAKYKELDITVQKQQQMLEKAQDEMRDLAKKFGRPDLAAAGVKVKSFGEELNEKLMGVKDQLLQMKSRNTKEFVDISTKAVGTITMGNYTGGTIGLTTWDPEVADAPRREAGIMRQLVRVQPVDGMYVAWAEKNGQGEGGADTVAEGAVKPKKDLDWIEASKKVEKIAVTYKASKESLKFIPALRAEINDDGVEEVNLELDDQILNGNGTTPNLSGIMNYAPTLSVAGTQFAAGATTGIYLPNMFDVIFVAQTLIQNAYYTPNIVLVNNLDFAHAVTLKDPNTGASIQPAPYVANGGRQVGSVRLVPTPLMPAGNFLVGDFNRDTLRVAEELNIQIGYENDDFTRNLVTILFEMMAVNYIKSNHIQAFRKGVFATVQTAITRTQPA